ISSTSVPGADVVIVCGAPICAHLVNALQRAPSSKESPEAGADKLARLAKRGVPVWPLYVFAYGLVPSVMALYALLCVWQSIIVPALFEDDEGAPSSGGPGAASARGPSVAHR
ncbi:unnamed protein product, partial [Polarella glacialis]